MREILFRAQAINRDKGKHTTNYKNGEWVYGLITRLYDERFPNLPAKMSNEDGVTEIEVDYKTIGQYIGVTDKNDKEIFEGDIVKSYNGHIGWVEFCSSTFVKRCRCHIFKNAIHGDDQIVIGNIYDNPELLRSDTE